LSESVAYNINRQAADVRLFEIGSVFSPAHGERNAVGWVMTGSRGEHWTGTDGAIDFSDAKGIAEVIAAAVGVGLSVAEASDLMWLAPGQRARLTVADGVAAGWIGRLAAPRGVDDAVFAGEIDLDALAPFIADRAAPIAPLPRHPAIVRDLSILVDERLPAADVRGTIRANAPATLANVHEFDRYQGTGVAPGQVSLSMRLMFRDAGRTLTDAEVQPAIDAIVQALAREHGATLRGA
jgi:phenylalanyl-tRNA synthetase beta chain